jgi:hypothetical protein
MGENLGSCTSGEELINHENIQGAHKTKLPKTQWPNEDLDKWSE